MSWTRATTTTSTRVRAWATDQLFIVVYADEDSNKALLMLMKLSVPTVNIESNIRGAEPCNVTEAGVMDQLNSILKIYSTHRSKKYIPLFLIRGHVKLNPLKLVYSDGTIFNSRFFKLRLLQVKALI